MLLMSMMAVVAKMEGVVVVMVEAVVVLRGVVVVVVLGGVVTEVSRKWVSVDSGVIGVVGDEVW